MEKFFDLFGRIPVYQKIAGFVVLAGLVAAVFYFGIHSTQQAEKDSLKRQIQNLETDLDKKSKLAKDIATFRRDVNKLDQQLKEALQLLPDKAEIPALLKKISAMGEKVGLEITAFTPLAEQNKEFYATVPVAMNIEGSYPEVLNFFDSIGKLPRIVNVSDYTMTLPTVGKKASTGKKIALETKCVATTYRFIEAAKK